VTYAYVPVGEEFCTAATNPIDEITTKNKRRAIEAKTIGYNFSFFFIFFHPLKFFHSTGYDFRS
jgi:hypothetical protein